MHDRQLPEGRRGLDGGPFGEVDPLVLELNPANLERQANLWGLRV
jgi:hypothetical protein